MPVPVAASLLQCLALRILQALSTNQGRCERSRYAVRGGHDERPQDEEDAVKGNCNPPAIVHHEPTTQEGAKHSTDLGRPHDELILPHRAVKLAPAPAAVVMCPASLREAAQARLSWTLGTPYVDERAAYQSQVIPAG